MVACVLRFKDDDRRDELSVTKDFTILVERHGHSCRDAVDCLLIALNDRDVFVHTILSGGVTALNPRKLFTTIK